jgi:hypothetical protein
MSTTATDAATGATISVNLPSGGSGGLVADITSGAIFGPKPWNVITPAVLAFLLAPNFIINLSGQAPFVRFQPWSQAAAMDMVKYTAVYMIALIAIRRMFPQMY